MNNIQIEINNSGYESLLQSLIDVIQEEHIKIGYRKEVVRLYYPVKSVNNLLGTNATSNLLLDVLEGFVSFSKSKLGEIEYSVDNDRFCFVIPEAGVEFVHENVSDRKFLRDFIEVINDCHCEIRDIERVFKSYSEFYHCEAANNKEFDYLLWFQDGVPDRYIYCIKFEDSHAIYHRFTKKDYEDFKFLN